MNNSIYYFVSFALLFLSSCGDQQKQTEFSTAELSFETAPVPQVETPIKREKAELEAHYIMSKQFGIPIGALQLPPSWKKQAPNSENIYLESPNGIKIYNEVLNSFFYSNNPERNQFTAQAGSQVKPVKSLQQFIKEDLTTQMQGIGARYLNQFPLPQLADFDNKFNSYLFKSTPEQRQNACIVTEWETKEGNLGFVIVRYFVAQYTSLGGLDWGYTLNILEAPKSEYEAAKNTYINALINYQINPNWLQASNQYYAQAAQQSSINHQNTMASIQAQGASIRAAGQANSQILDNQFNSWKTRQTTSDISHSNYIDGIYDRRNMTDQTGNTYQVDGYENNVWMNTNNEYIATDNSLYNPNTDNTTNYNWQQLDETDDNY